MKNYLKFTEVVDSNESMMSIVVSFGNNPYEIVIKALSWIRSNIAPMDESLKKEVWRGRKSSEIFSSRQASGCTDKAILLLSFLRMANIACSYVESISKQTLDEFKSQKYTGAFEGHVFVKVYLKEITILVDPTKHQVFLKNELPITSFASNNLIVAEGLDFIDIGTDTQENLEGLVRDLIEDNKL